MSANTIGSTQNIKVINLTAEASTLSNASASAITGFPVSGATGVETGRLLELNLGDNRAVAVPGGNAKGTLTGWYNGGTGWDADYARLGYNLNPNNPSIVENAGADAHYVEVGYDRVNVGYVASNASSGDARNGIISVNKNGFQGMTTGSVAIGASGSSNIPYPGMTTGGLVLTTTRHPGSNVSHASAEADAFNVFGTNGETITWQVIAKA